MVRLCTTYFNINWLRIITDEFRTILSVNGDFFP
jgi:hypothetical protein